MKNRLGIALSALLLVTLACEPVIAIGWQELLILILVIGFLIGPPLYRFFRTFEKYRNKKGK
jgi:hypothetical protein